MFPPPIPPGWAALQESAKRSKDSEELSRIIDEMNKLLDEYEAKHGFDEQNPNVGESGIRQHKK